MAAFRADPCGKPASVFEMNISVRDCSCKHAFCCDVFVRTDAYREGAMGDGVFAQLGAAFWTDMVLSQIQTQSESLLNNYMFPEKAMYSPCISDIIGAFYTEEYDGWKIRIDMIQHHLSGYYKLYCNYELYFIR